MSQPERFIVVFDCNVYLGVADLLGAPFSWDKFDATAARLASEPFPHPVRPNDSLRAIALCTSGRLAGPHTLEVWTSAHIDKVVLDKAAQSPVPDPMTGYKGLGWSNGDASGIVTDLVYGLTERSSGGTIGHDYQPEGNPPLDHEDGMVFGACRRLAGDDPLANVLCVTCDIEFLRAYTRGEVNQHYAKVLTPSQFVGLVRQARASFAVKRMPVPRASS